MAELGRRLGAAKDVPMWWIGDWFLLAKRTHGSTYAEATAITGLSYRALRGAAHVCGAIDARRRREAVSFAQHRAIADLSPRAQDRALQRAQEQQLGVEPPATPKKRKSPPPWFGWARLDYRPIANCNALDLSAAAEDGLAIAEQLADEAWERAQAFPHPLEYESTSFDELGARERGYVKKARREMFGTLSDSGIRMRLWRRRRAMRARPARECEAPGCSGQIPRGAHKGRHFCRDACRVAAHRAAT
jgi:hypothetical protein